MSTAASRRKQPQTRVSAADALAAPTRDYSRIILPPSTYAQEREKIQVRYPAALRFVAERGLNEVIDADASDIGIVLQGGLYNNTLRALELLDCADAFGGTKVPRTSSTSRIRSYRKNGRSSAAASAQC